MFKDEGKIFKLNHKPFKSMGTHIHQCESVQTRAER